MVQAALLAILLASATSAHPTTELSSRLHRKDTQPTANITSFKDVPRSCELKWVPCYDVYQCANLVVPLDYENPALGRTVVPWIRQVANNGTGTDLLFNPGGPGGSGIQSILLGVGNELMELTGSKYNIVSFDPRGVNASDIDLSCSPNDQNTPAAIFGDLNANKTELYAQAIELKTYCATENRNTTARFVGTVAVVQDIMHFTELQAALKGEEKPKESLVWYLGASYGTVIGQTLAALYPDRIGRVINAANVDSEEHYNGLTRGSVSDTDKSMREFFQLCSEAGEKNCLFARNSTTAQDLETRFDDLLSRIDREPAEVADPASGDAQKITRSSVLERVHRWLYSPTTMFPLMAHALAGLENGNTTAWQEVVMLTTQNDSGPFNYTTKAQLDMLIFVTSVDAAGRYPIHNVSEYLDVVEYYKSTSKWFGEKYATSNALIDAGPSVLPPKSQLFAGESLLFLLLCSTPSIPTSHLTSPPQKYKAADHRQASRKPKPKTPSSSSTRCATPSRPSPARTRWQPSSKAAALLRRTLAGIVRSTPSRRARTSRCRCTWTVGKCQRGA